MQLSKLVLNLETRQARTDLANPYEMHRTLSWAFVGDTTGRPARFLWRAESGRSVASPTVLVQSAVRPAWDAVQRRFPDYLAEVGVKAYSSLERLRAGSVLRFRLKANPTITRNGKRHGLRSKDDQEAWLRRQGERSGFAVLDCAISQPRLLRARRRGLAVNSITVQVVTYDGYLRVTDPAEFATTVRSGLGHAKALGLGLLSIAAIRR